MNDMIREIAKNHLHPLLKPLGFKYKNLAWNRRRGEFVDVITLQKAKYSTPREQAITGNVAVCVPEFREIMFSKPVAFFIEADGVFTVRFSELAANDLSGRALDRWWKLTDETKDAVALELSDIVQLKVIPFLNSCTDFAMLEGRLNTITGRHAKIPYFQLNKALVYWKLGDRAKCDEVLSSPIASKWAEKVTMIREWIMKHDRA
ncbi:MAG: DUF4304 domain-containing protein [Planctomycetia bacterium]|nr:DUF4304 domain-containing protein [Planctomycetia bacterium]